MTWTLECKRTLRIVDLVFSGIISGRDLREATTKCILPGKEQGALQFLVDAEELELFAPLVDIIDLPDKQYVAEGLDRLSRVALVNPGSPKAKEAAFFYGTVCVNRGWSVRLFPTRDDAIEWLTTALFSKKNRMQATLDCSVRSAALNVRIPHRQPPDRGRFRPCRMRYKQRGSLGRAYYCRVLACR